MISTVFALSLHSFQEALRSKLFAIFFVIVGVLFCVAPMMPSIGDPISQMKLSLSVGHFICYFFGLVIISILSSSFVYEDILSKRIYTVMSKPVSRLAYLLGKFFGIVLLSFGLFFVFAVIFILFVELVKNNLSEENKKQADSFLMPIRYYPIDDAKYFRKNNKASQNRFVDRLEIKYDNISNDNFSYSMGLNAHANFESFNNDGRLYLDFSFYQKNMDGKKVEVKEVSLVPNKYKNFELPLELSKILNKEMIVVIEISEKCKEYISGFMVSQEMIFLQKLPGNFYWHVFKSFFIMAFQIVLIGVIGLAGSVRMSFYISTMFSWTLFSVGYFSGFYREYMHQKKVKIANDLIEAEGFWFHVNNFFDHYLVYMSYLVPDFGRFSLKNELINSIDMSQSHLFNILFHYSIYTLIYLLLGFLLFRRREV